MGEAKKPAPMRLGDAVARGIIANETLAYFIGRTWLFFKKVGIDPARMRFRQHLLHEVSGQHVVLRSVSRQLHVLLGSTVHTQQGFLGRGGGFMQLDIGWNGPFI
jgi:hypothetical protein